MRSRGLEGHEERRMVLDSCNRMEWAQARAWIQSMRSPPGAGKPWARTVPEVTKSAAALKCKSRAQVGGRVHPNLERSYRQWQTRARAPHLNTLRQDLAKT